MSVVETASSKLIAQANQWYKMYSIQLMIIASTILGVYESLPKETQAIVPTSILHTCVIVLLALSGISRLIKQNSLTTSQPSIVKEIEALIPPADQAAFAGIVQVVTQVGAAVDAVQAANQKAKSASPE